MTRLDLRLFGAFELYRDGEPVIGFKSDKARALLAFLAIEANQAHRREYLAGLLWPESSQLAALTSLRSALANLRKVTRADHYSPPLLSATSRTIKMNRSDSFWVDIDEFASNVAALDSQERLERAVNCYRGPFLEGFTVPDSLAFEEWSLVMRQGYHLQILDALANLSSHYEHSQDYGRAIDCARRQVELEPWREEGYQSLMRLLYLGGQRASAVAQYQSLSDILSTDLDVAPSLESTALYQAILEDRLGGYVRFVPDAPPEPGVPPYKGLQFFDEADAGMFFGREPLTSSLLGALETIASSSTGVNQGTARVLTLVGASGSGKSSLVRAGLIPALKQKVQPHPSDSSLPAVQAWQVEMLKLSEHPLAALSTGWMPGSLPSAGEGLQTATTEGAQIRLTSVKRLIVVDQFEELFTLCRDESERTVFIDKLLDLAEGSIPVTVLIALRADFYANCAFYPRLRQALCVQQVFIGSMALEELRTAIVEPARRAGWEIEPGLVDLILRDTGSEPGSLPLLSHALRETWERRSGRTLILKGYAETGGVQGAIAKTAGTVFNSLEPAEQIIARRVFLRLTEAAEGNQDTRRRARKDELASSPEEVDRVEAILDILAGARLVTISEVMVEMSHEALIREWPALRGWLDEDRQGLYLHRHLGQAAQAWIEMQRDPGELYRGTRLAQALEWVGKLDNREELNDLERSFLAESQAEAEREAAQRQSMQERELEAAVKLAESEKQRAEMQASTAQRLRQRAWFLTLSLFLVLVLSGAAFYFARRNAILAGQNAASASYAQFQQATAQAASTRALEQAALASTQQVLARSEAQARATAQAVAEQKQRTAEDQTRLAQASELALAANNAIEYDPELSNLLVLEALSILNLGELPTPMDVQEALHQAVLASRLRHTWKVYEGDILSLVFSPDGKLLAIAREDGITNILDASTGQVLVDLHGHRGEVYDVAFSPDGVLLATAGGDGTVRIWKASSGMPVSTYAGHMGEINAVAYSPEGSTLASAGADGLVKVWQTSDGEDILTLSGSGDGWSDLDFNPDGSRLAVVGGEGKVFLWDPKSGERISTISASEMDLWGVAFSPDGAHLASCGQDLTTRIWDINTGELLLSLVGHQGPVRQVAFSPDGARLATASQEGTAILWDAVTGLEIERLSAQAGAVNDLSFSPGCLGSPDTPFEGCGAWLVTANRDGTLRIWDMTPVGHSEFLTLPGFNGIYLEDGSLLTTALGPGGTLVFDTWGGGSNPVDQHSASVTLSGFSAPVIAGSFRPDRSRAATVTEDGIAQLWDLTTGSLLSSFPISSHYEIIEAIDLAPDGVHLATASDDGSARVWDATTGVEILTLLGHTEYVWGISFSPDGSRLATAGTDRTVWIWDSLSGEALFTLHASTLPVSTVAFSHDGSRLVSAGMDGTARVWSATTGKLLLTLEGHSATVISAVFSPDGTRLATGSYDGTIRIWDVTDGDTSGQALLTLPTPSWPNWLVFNASSTRLVKGSYQDMIVQVYTLDVAELAEIARSRVTRSLTVEECRKYLRLEKCP